MWVCVGEDVTKASFFLAPVLMGWLPPPFGEGLEMYNTRIFFPPSLFQLLRFLDVMGKGPSILNSFSISDLLFAVSVSGS